MITKDELLTYVKDPLLLSNVNEEQLLELAKTHPYFQTAHSLYSKKAALADNPIKEHYIEKASAYSSDRKHLHFLHHNPEWSISNLPKLPIVEIANKETEVSNEPAPSAANADTPVLSTPTIFTVNPDEFTALIVISALAEKPLLWIIP